MRDLDTLRSYSAATQHERECRSGQFAPGNPPKNFFRLAGTGFRDARSALRIVTLCPPALAIHDIGPEASTLPPGDVSGPKFVRGPAVAAMRWSRHQIRWLHGTNGPRRTLNLCQVSPPAQFRRIPMRKLVGLAFIGCALLVSACNTIEGAGKDVSSAGDTVADTANDAK